MEEKVYVVTLYNHEDLEQFYDEMAANSFRLSMKREMSRNTHYWMNDEQAEILRQDSRVWGVEAVDSFKCETNGVNNPSPYTKNGTFSKTTTTSSPTSDNYFNWGHLHCAGTAVQRRKGIWGSDLLNYTVTDSVNIFNNGKHVDVVIVDDPVSYDCAEWNSPSTGQTRFVQYQWFNELNNYVASIDDDSQSRPTGTITYSSNATNIYYHGNHVSGTVAGQHYGWAREANIYNIATTTSWPSGQIVQGLLTFDYLRAFNRYKPINPLTGKRNPTVTNHSYGGIVSNSQNLTFANLSSLVWRGVTYKQTNPGPSGVWTQPAVEADFGVRFGSSNYYPSWSSSIAADVQDAIREGIIVIGSAGNANLYVANGPSDPDWNNYINWTGVGSIYYNRGSWPNSPDTGSINTGALSRQSDFKRAAFSNFGTGIKIWAPGEAILSAYTSNGGTADGKYGGVNYYKAISGTSMAAPQVCGIAAVIASGKERFTQQDILKYIEKTSIPDEITFDTVDGSFVDATCGKGSPNKVIACVNPRQTSGVIDSPIGLRKTSGQVFPRVKTLNAAPIGISQQTFTLNISASSASNYTISGVDRNGIVSGGNPAITIYVGDTIAFLLGTGITSHPLWIKTNQVVGTGGGVTSGTITNNGGILAGEIVSWSTTGVTPGIYYYICQYHSSMSRTITVLALPV